MLEPKYEVNGRNWDELSLQDLQNFCQVLESKVGTRLTFTVDYLKFDFDPTNETICSTSLEFCVALLNEVLCKLTPCNQLWHKVKFAAFVLSIANKNTDFAILYSIFHQVEKEVVSSDIDWGDDKVKSLFQDEIVDKLLVKHDFQAEHEDQEYESYDYTSAEAPHQNELKIKSEENLESKPRISKKRSSDTWLEKVEDSDEDISVKNEKQDQEWNTPKLKVIKKKKVKNENRKKKSTTEVQKVKKERKTKKHEPSSYTCNLCDFKVKNQDFSSHDSNLNKLIRHGFEVHKTERLCTQCGHLSNSYDEYKAHEKTHLVTCEICQEKFVSKQAMKKHKKMKHTDRDIVKVSCEVCGKLLSEASLKNHMIGVHGDQKYTCDICHQVFNTTLGNFKKHRQNHLQKPEKCPECGKLVKRLAQHLSLNQCGNTKSKEVYQCDECDKVFKFKHGLKRHKKYVHLKLFSHFCDLCTFKTCSKNNLSTHVKMVHLKESRYIICPICSAKTSNLEHHCKIRHPEEFVSGSIPQLKNDHIVTINFDNSDQIGKSE